MAAIVVTVQTDDFFVLGNFDDIPSGGVRIVALPDLLNDNRSLHVEEPQTVNRKARRILQEADGADRFGGIDVHPGETLCFSRISKSRALSVMSEVELQLVQLISALVAEAVQLELLVERHLNYILLRWPAELDALAHSYHGHVVKFGLPIASDCTSLLHSVQDSFNHGLASELSFAEQMLGDVARLLDFLRLASNSNVVVVVL